VRFAESFSGGSDRSGDGGRDDGGITASLNARERQHKSISLMFYSAHRYEAEPRRRAEMRHSDSVWSDCAEGGLPLILSGNRAI